jgi:hypothetical protein
MDPIMGKVGGSGDARLKAFYAPTKNKRLFTESQGIFNNKKRKLFS